MNDMDKQYLKKYYRITRCYLVQRIGSEGNELEYDYVFGTRKDAEEYALHWFPVRDNESEL